MEESGTQTAVDVLEDSGRTAGEMSLKTVFDLDALDIAFTAEKVGKLFQPLNHLDGISVTFKQQKVVDGFAQLLRVHRKSLTVFSNGLFLLRVGRRGYCGWAFSVGCPVGNQCL